MARRTQRVGKVKGRLCAIDKKVLKTYACAHKRKCRVVKVGKVVANGNVRGTVYCCARKSGGRVRRGLRRLRSHWQRTGGRWRFR